MDAHTHRLLKKSAYLARVRLRKVIEEGLPDDKKKEREDIKQLLDALDRAHLQLLRQDDLIAVMYFLSHRSATKKEIAAETGVYLPELHSMLQKKYFSHEGDVYSLRKPQVQGYSDGSK